MDEPTLRLDLQAFAPAIDTEIVRWALEHHGVDHGIRFYTPEAYALVMARRWRRATPICRTPAGTMGGAAAIVAMIDAQAPAERRLLASASADDVAHAWSEYNGRLGFAVASIVYRSVLRSPRHAKPLLTAGVTRSQGWIHAVFGPLVRWVFRSVLPLSEVYAVADRCLEDIVGELETRLADGRPYLGGDAFGILDVLCCAALAPVIGPREHPGPLPEGTNLPAIATLRASLRARPIGAYVRAVYGSHRFVVRERETVTAADLGVVPDPLPSPAPPAT